MFVKIEAGRWKPSVGNGLWYGRALDPSANVLVIIISLDLYQRWFFFFEQCIRDDLMPWSIIIYDTNSFIYTFQIIKEEGCHILVLPYISWTIAYGSWGYIYSMGSHSVGGLFLSPRIFYNGKIFVICYFSFNNFFSLY